MDRYWSVAWGLGTPDRDYFHEVPLIDLTYHVLWQAIKNWAPWHAGETWTINMECSTIFLLERMLRQWLKSCICLSCNYPFIWLIICRCYTDDWGLFNYFYFRHLVTCETWLVYMTPWSLTFLNIYHNYISCLLSFFLSSLDITLMCNDWAHVRLGQMGFKKTWVAYEVAEI